MKLTYEVIDEIPIKFKEYCNNESIFMIKKKTIL